jgi:RimJ/RimL family protein N-acetyltransferase
MDASLRVTPLSKRWWALVAGASVAFASIGATPAWAEDAPSETPPSEPAAEAEYVPPPEAHEGVGGWAVVDPETGNVHGVIVGTIETFNSRGGAIGHEYMGCHSNCVLRFQTRATADGNVAGWRGIPPRELSP